MSAYVAIGDMQVSSCPTKFLRVSATADGVNNVIPPVAGKRIRITGYALTHQKAATKRITFQDSDGTIRGELEIGNGIPAVFTGGLLCPAFETGEGKGLDLLNPVDVDVIGHLSYQEV